MLPEPRTRKRFAAPFFVFILGMTVLLSSSLTPGGSLRERLMPRLSLVSRYAEAGFAAALAGGVFGFSGFGFSALALPTGPGFFFGASTITIWRPSSFGNCSTSP